MKKIFIAVFFLLLVFASCSAESGMKYIDATVDGNVLSEANADLAQIEIDFCDTPGEKLIGYTMAQGSHQDICLKASNLSDKAIEATIAFVDGSLTNDQRKNKACMQEGEDKKFGQYVSGFSASFTIPANDSIIQHATFTLPKGSTGIINGCLVYYTKSVKMGGGMNFSVLMRKAKFIDIQVRENNFFKKNILWIIILIFLSYGASIYVKHTTKKLPKR